MLTSDDSLLQSAPVWSSRLNASMGIAPQRSVPRGAMPMLTSDDSLPEVRRIGRGSLRSTLYSLLSTLYALLSTLYFLLSTLYFGGLASLTEKA